MTKDEAQPAPVQEPWCMNMNGCKTKCEDCPDYVPPAQSAPQSPAAQRTWAGLTDEEVMELAFNFDVPSLVIRTAEAKLKEKNT